MKNYRILIGIVTLFLQACAVGPDYVKPKTVVPLHYKEIKSKEWKIVQPRDDFNRGKWWKIFNDKKLNELEDKLNISNQNIALAYANYMQSRALVDEARAAYFPTLDFSLMFMRQKSGNGSTSFSSVSSTGQNSSGAATVVSPNSGSSSNIFSNKNFLLNAAWAPDIWGEVRRTVEASQAGAQASAATLANARLSAQGSLAQTYFELRALDTDQQLLDNTVRDYKKSLALTQNQYAAGVVSRADVITAQTQLQSAQSLAINNRINRALYSHAIAVLIGQTPASLDLPSMPLKAMPPPIPVDLPSALLERRPDIAQAERLMAQANAQIGVAVAAYFPTINLNATLNGASHGTWTHLFSTPAMGWSYGPQLSQLIYDGGLRSATIDAAKQAYEASVASYRQTVLTAFQNVEDNLASLRILGEQAVVQNQAAESARLALKLTMNQYKAGTVPYASVITAQIAAYNAQKSAADISGLRMTAAVGLIMALGGGWHNNVCN